LTESFSLSIAGLRFSVRSESGYEVEHPDALYRPFLNAEFPSDLLMNVMISAEPEPDWSSQEILFDTGEAWTAYRLENGIGIYFPYSKDPGFLWTAQLSENFDQVTVHCSSLMITENNRIANPVHYPLDQILAMFHFSAHRGLIVHAAGIARGDIGVFCAGRSGAGKTTLMRQWKDVSGIRGLSDDRIVVREIDGAFRFFGTPWAGEGQVAAYGDVALKALAFIHHGSENCIRPISPASALKQLMPTSSILWFDRSSLEKTLSFCHDLVETIPAFEIHCRPDPSAADLIDQLLS